MHPAWYTFFYKYHITQMLALVILVLKFKFSKFDAQPIWNYILETFRSPSFFIPTRLPSHKSSFSPFSKNLILKIEQFLQKPLQSVLSFPLCVDMVAEVGC